jgi:hypothetical protein
MGYFHENHLIFGDPGKGCVVAKGIALNFPDLSSSDDASLAELERDLGIIVRSLLPGEKLQFQFDTNSELGAPLQGFHEKTAASVNAPQVSIDTRVELFNRFCRRIEEQTLIQNHTRLYLSTKMQPFVKENGKTVKGFDGVLQVIQRSFLERERSFDQLLRRYGGGARGLDNLGHYRELLRFWSPQQARHPQREQIDWMRTMEDLCRFSDAAPRAEPDHGFYLDGHYVGVWACKALPTATTARTMQIFHQLTVPGLRVVLNVEPVELRKEIRRLDSEYVNLASNIDEKNPKPSIRHGLAIPDQQIEHLMLGGAHPYRLQLIVVATDRTADGLDAKMEMLRTALWKTGCEPYRPALATSTLSFFDAATPGHGPWSRYGDYRHRVYDLNVANLLPAGSTPKGDLDHADWILDGDCNNLVGFRFFVGAQPVHLAVIGPQGGGKSVLLQTLLIQGSLRTKFLFVIDNGASYLASCRKLDPRCRPIVVNANSEHTFNLFDPRGLPWSAAHLSNATALAHLLVGNAGNRFEDRLVGSLLSETIQSVYATAYRSWRNANPEEHFELCREAHALLWFRYACRGGKGSALDVFLEAREARRRDPNALGEYEETNEEEVLSVDRNPDTESFVRDLACARWNRDQFPTLSDLQDELKALSRQAVEHAKLCATLATLLNDWLRDGRYGAIVDGPSNLDLGATDIRESDPLKVLYFELGELGESQTELRRVVGFFITGEVRNHLMGMPRSIRKQGVIEELTAFMDVPGGDKITKDFFERMRKYNAQVTAVFQQYGTLESAHPDVAKAVMGNCLGVLLLRNSKADLDAISERVVEIPEVVKQRLMSFPQPETLKGRDDAYGGFVYVDKAGDRPTFTAGRNVLSPELERLTSSSGDVHEQRKQESKQHERLVKTP